MSDETEHPLGDGVEFGEPDTQDAEQFIPTAPQFPVEVKLQSFSWWIQKYPHGPVELKFCGTIVQNTPQGPMQQTIPPGYSIMFPDEATWERFQEHVGLTEVPTGPTVQPVPAAALDQLRARRDADAEALRHVKR